MVTPTHHLKKPSPGNSGEGFFVVCFDPFWSLFAESLNFSFSQA